MAVCESVCVANAQKCENMTWAWLGDVLEFGRIRKSNPVNLATSSGSAALSNRYDGASNAVYKSVS